MTKQTFALVDCNNFYASCEKLFRPDLKNRPVVVLSNNDGCVIARCAKAKALGIKMATPLFQIRSQIKRFGIKTFSSNYALYADLSDRVMQVLAELTPHLEIYSIDEAFVDLTGLPRLETGHKIRSTIAQWLGLTVCVGIAPTKTLAKLANYAAKHYPATGGVVDLSDRQRQRKLLALVPVHEVWGVGRQLSKQLNHLGIITALDLANYPAKKIAKQFSVVLERTLYELNAEPCLELDTITEAKQQIVCSRSFGQKITQFNAMAEAVSSYTAQASEKLRKQQQQAKILTLFIHATGPYTYRNSASGRLVIPSADSRELITLAKSLLKQIWQPDYRYSKAGVILSDFYDGNSVQLELFPPSAQYRHSQSLMSVIDKLNQRQLGQLFFAGQGIDQNWAMKRQYLSPAYTTRWTDLVRVN